MKPKTKVKIETCTKTRVETTHTIELRQSQILEMLGIDPQNVEVFVRVPGGGGDWSNMELDISPSVPLIVRWKETKDEEGREEKHGST